MPREAANRKPTPERHCAGCGTQLERRRRPSGGLEPLAAFNKRLYCSDECRGIAKHPCPGCGEPVGNKTDYCSRECRTSHLTITVRCVVCLAPFDTYRSSPAKHCGRECYAATVSNRQRGKRSHLWKHGRSTENQRIRAHRGYADWRRRVFERDDFTCQSCFVKGGELHAHHIVKFADDPKLRLKISNGITLCDSCHRLFHNTEAKRGGLESSLWGAVDRFLRAEPGVWHLKIAGGTMQRGGIPDVLICVCGRFLMVELKVPPYFASPRQIHEIRRINDAGGIARVCRSVQEVAALVYAIKDLDDIDQEHQ